MGVTCIIPARNAEGTIGLCVEAVLASTRRPDEVIVVDDASTDRTAELAEQAGARVLRLGGAAPSGPARARNHAARIASGDVLVFVDSDVVVRPCAIRRLVERVATDERCAGAFGSYCDSPPGRRLAGRYKNLLHHYTHQHAPSEAATFWAGLGCVRAAVFRSVGGFDERYAAPSIEDIELGVRIRAAGWKIAVVHDACGTHLKDWSVAQVWRTDILGRAAPWTRLMRRSGVPTQLNVGVRERFAAIAAAGAVGGAMLGAWHASGFALAASALLVCAAMNAPFLGLLARRGGVPLLAVGAGMHLAYYLYSLATFALVWAFEGRADQGTAVSDSREIHGDASDVRAPDPRSP